MGAKTASPFHEEKERPVQLGFRVSKWVYAGLQRLTNERGGPMSDLAYEALVAYLKRQGITAPAAGGRR